MEGKKEPIQNGYLRVIQLHTFSSYFSEIPKFSITSVSYFYLKKKLSETPKLNELNFCCNHSQAMVTQL
jgi:hypothetical protein